MQNPTKIMSVSQHKSAIISNYSLPSLKNNEETCQTIYTQLEEEITRVEEYVREKTYQKIQEKIQGIVKQNIQPKINDLQKIGNQINEQTRELELAILSFKKIALEVNHLYRQINIKQSKKVGMSQLCSNNLVSINLLKLPIVVKEPTGYILKDKIFPILSEGD